MLLTVPLLTSLILYDKVLVYYFTFDLVEGDVQDFLESVRIELRKSDKVSARLIVKSSLVSTQLSL